MSHIKCPVENCKGFDTYSGRPNPANHIKSLAKSELLTEFILDDNTSEPDRPHADWLKAHAKMETVTVFKIGKYKFSLER